MEEKIINIFKMIISFVIFFCLSSVIALIFKLCGFDFSLFNHKDYGYYECLVELIFAVLIYLLYRKYFKKDLLDLENNRKKYINDIAMYLVMFFAIKIASGIVTALIGYVIGATITESENQNLIVKITENAPILMLISTVIFAPLVEEGVFRLSLRKVFKNEYLFILISGLLFGFMHIFPTEMLMSEALTYSITYVTMGFFLSYLYVKTDNIWINIIIHGLNNLLSMIAVILFM